MSLIQWGSALEVGVKEIDGQHQILVRMLNDLHDAMGKGHGKEALEKLFNDLASYTASHFAMEERLMQRRAYPQRDDHLQEHNELIKTIAKLQSDFGAGKVMLTLDVMKFLKEWLGKHILGTDKALATFLNGVAVH